jgi:ERCC4-type nuclease
LDAIERGMSSEDNDKVRIVIDMREDALWDALEAEEGYELEKAPLDVGDIAFYIRQPDGTEREVAVLERKAAEDLGASQRDGRYREQRARLLAKRGSGVVAGYVLEIPVWSSDMSRSWCHGKFTETHLMNTIMRLQMRYGLTVFQVRDVEETAMCVRHIARALVADPKVFEGGLAETATAAAAVYAEAIHIKKAANMSADRVFVTLLRTVPGVGPAAAEAIQGHVGSAGFPGFFALSEAEIAAISQGNKNRKVGAAVAKKLWTTFHTSS